MWHLDEIVRQNAEPERPIRTHATAMEAADHRTRLTIRNDGMRRTFELSGMIDSESLDDAIDELHTLRRCYQIENAREDARVSAMLAAAGIDPPELDLPEWMTRE